MKFKNINAIILRILSQFRHDPRTLALMFIAPIIILSLLGYLLRGGNSNPSIDIVNLDKGNFGSQIITKTSLIKSINISITDLNNAENDLKTGKNQAYILLPANFSQNIIMSQNINPEIFLEGSQPVQAKNLLQSLINIFSPNQIHFTPNIKYLYGGPSLDSLDYFGAAFIGIIVFFLVFVITSISFLRERTQGTLERLMASPLRSLEIVIGYMFAFTIIALIQALIVLLFCLYILNIYNIGNILDILIIEVLMVIAAVNTGIFLSMFAKTEFQAVQFIPLVIVPQVLLSGIIFPINLEPTVMQNISNILPLTYAVSGLRDIMIKGADLKSNNIQLDILVLIGFSLLMIIGALVTLKRRIA